MDGYNSAVIHNRTIEAKSILASPGLRGAYSVGNRASGVKEDEKNDRTCTNAVIH